MRTFIVGFFACFVFTSAVFAEALKMAVTTSFYNSGLSEILLPQIQKDTGIELQLLIVGTGQALRLGQQGDVDAVFVHSKKAEEAFIREGYGSRRTEIMYNDFVLIGPKSDPAGIRSAKSATDALSKIAEAKANFVSRGDDSGTHKKELSLWANADQSLSESTEWYRAVGAGMGAALNTASGMNAYIMSDRASWLNFGNKGELALLYSGDPILFNQYAFLPVSEKLHPHVKSELVAVLETWLTSATAEKLINNYTINGEALFVFNAK